MGAPSHSKRVTEIAAFSGCSPKTVERFLRGDKVWDSNRVRIRRAMQQLDGAKPEPPTPTLVGGLCELARAIDKLADGVMAFVLLRKEERSVHPSQKGDR